MHDDIGIPGVRILSRYVYVRTDMDSPRPVDRANGECHGNDRLLSLAILGTPKISMSPRIGSSTSSKGFI